MKRMLKIGLPSGVEQLALRTGQVEFARTTASLGTTVFAAHQIALNVVGLSFAPSQAFSIAATTLVGQSLGANRPDIAEKCGLETRRLGMMVAASIATLFSFSANKSPIYTGGGGRAHGCRSPEDSCHHATLTVHPVYSGGCATRCWRYSLAPVFYHDRDLVHPSCVRKDIY